VLTIGAATTGALSVASTAVSVVSQASAQAAVSAVQAAISSVASIEATSGHPEPVVGGRGQPHGGQQNLQSAYSAWST